MKITTFNPLIVSKDADSAISLFEELGFEKRHTPFVDTGDRQVVRTRMKDENGFYVDISQAEALPVECLTAIRMNVDDFDEAYRLMLSHGFKNYYGDQTVDTKSARSAVMVSPSGIAINLILLVLLALLFFGGLRS